MAGRNPTRRNRNIGTAKSGHRRQSHYDVPLVMEDVSGCARETRTVHGRPLAFLVQETRAGFVHPCTTEEVASVLAALPAADVDGIGLVFLDQPTRKRELLRPAWGRIIFESEIGGYSGPAVILESVDPTDPLPVTRSLTPSAAKELKRLREDGHRVEQTKRSHLVHLSVDAARRGLLLRTLPHEIGHWVQYKRYRESGAPYDSLPRQEHEDFANRYADEHRAAAVAALESR